MTTTLPTAASYDERFTFAGLTLVEDGDRLFCVYPVRPDGETLADYAARVTADLTAAQDRAADLADAWEPLILDHFDAEWQSARWSQVADAVAGVLDDLPVMAGATLAD